MRSTSQKKVEEIILKISEKYGNSRDLARKMLHKFVCMGKCNWYKTRSNQAGFNRLGLTEQERKDIGKIISGIMKRISSNEAAYEIHCVLCPGESRPKP